MQYWPKTDEQKQQAIAFAIGEGTSYFSAPGALVFCEDVLPNQMQFIKNTLAHSIIEPNLKFFEKFASWFGAENHSKQNTNSNKAILPVDSKKRAFEISDTLVKFGVANFIGGTFVSYGVQTAAEKVLKTPNLPTADKVQMRAWEFVGHYGSTIMLGTIFSPFAERAKTVVSKILENVGISKKDSDNISFATVYTVLPEIIGSAVGFVSMTRLMGKSTSPRL